MSPFCPQCLERPPSRLPRPEGRAASATCSQDLPALVAAWQRFPQSLAGRPAAHCSVLTWCATTTPGLPATASNRACPNNSHSEGLCQRFTPTDFLPSGAAPSLLISLAAAVCRAPDQKILFVKCAL